MKTKAVFIGALSAICINATAIAYDGYNIPCADGDSDSCTCDVGPCLDETWDDTLGTFMCDSGHATSYSCNCVDVQLNKTITFTCGRYSDSDCGGAPNYGCINNRCAKMQKLQRRKHRRFFIYAYGTHSICQQNSCFFIKRSV